MTEINLLSKNSLSILLLSNDVTGVANEQIEHSTNLKLSKSYSSLFNNSLTIKLNQQTAPPTAASKFVFKQEANTAKAAAAAMLSSCIFEPSSKIQPVIHL